MRWVLALLLLTGAAVAQTGRAQDVPSSEDRLDFRSGTSIAIATLKPSRTFILSGPDGKQASISWDGDVVKYSGDMPVNDAAKVFFEAVMSHLKKDCK